jgi:phage-related protein
MSETPERKLVWVASSLDDLRSFPKAVKLEIGAALAVAQKGGKSHRAKPLKRLGSGVLEVVDDHDGDTYRAVYTVRFSEAIFVLHCFQKKSTRGIKTPKREIDLVNSRLKAVAAQVAADDKRNKRR